ncbi:hypothetical protein [Aliidiomarina sanyensis]|uniref:hypothetical protein n=1 Tax=Aliidiomarina sanyensis TaxID=1249555 RepID=UPI000F880D66|nr:hypothetical protein [Aliidiomarina sanyensis]
MKKLEVIAAIVIVIATVLILNTCSSGPATVDEAAESLSETLDYIEEATQEEDDDEPPIDVPDETQRPPLDTP